MEEIHEFRTALSQFAEALALQQRLLDARQILGAELSSAWVMLENCRPQRMKGYGVRLDEQAQRTLEERVDQLLTRLRGLRAILQ